MAESMRRSRIPNGSPAKVPQPVTKSQNGSDRLAEFSRNWPPTIVVPPPKIRWPLAPIDRVSGYGSMIIRGSLARDYFIEP